MKSAFKINFAGVVVFGVLFAAVTCAAAEEKKKEDTTSTGTTASGAASAKALTIPKDAVSNPDGTYSYTDKQGKKWNYVKTAFGITRFPANDQPAVAATEDFSRIKVFDKGDTVRFERPGALGPLSWEKKKSELTDEERRIFDAYQAKTQRNEKAQ